MSSEASSKRRFEIRNSERCFRFKPDAFESHAPPYRGIYELVTFDERQQPTVLFVGAAFDRTIRESLEAHAAGTLKPTANEILDQFPNLYFDYLEQIGGNSLDDARDVHWWLVQRHKPRYNDVAAASNSGRAGEIEVVEID